MEKGQDNPGPGYVSNAVFIIDANDRVRYHAVLDARVMHNIEEIQRVVNALRATDSGNGIAMAKWKDNSDTVPNNRMAIENWYKNGGNKDAQAKGEDVRTDEQLASKQADAFWEYKYGSLVLTENIVENIN